jgi:hypothetical protein
MNLISMRAIVRVDLHDEDENNYRWTDDELDRHIAHAVKDYSEAFPREDRVTKATTAGSRDIDIASLTDRVMVEAVEYPVGEIPRRYQRFSIWGDTVTLCGSEVPGGSNAYIYYGKVHTLDTSGSTIPAWREDLIAAGTVGYAALEWAVFAVNKVNVGGSSTPDEMMKWGKERLDFFHAELKKLGRKNRVRPGHLYKLPGLFPGKITDPGP